ncbi:AP2 domain-containing protein [Sedimentibacter hydroxybenzoicus DSM 7310]|uniref:AP2 domain-containing protein n=1 Tax=Sedimentibacter hydroxybenzoicus DSM 7310 TaxID=1123245 RepID=A0A974BLD7_SEDHY|nr:AP2 domain-containing protein [Sedimentibacter hydroxybenzoicus]NYB74981.1 AP2 domain-containing protein [Sedimentibacter hydroxybenzoicus DSM 7310]
MKGTSKNIIGHKFGLLTVLREYRNEKGYLVYECICECGTIKTAYKSNIVSGRTKSCGCLEEKNRRKYRDISGRRFGRLIANRPTEHRSSGSIVWECSCDCGNTILVSGPNLTRGFTKSCGCYNLEKKDISNQRFGKLTSLYPDTSVENLPQKWICRCDCGNLCSVSISNLKNGHTQSCGCLQKIDYRTLIDGTCLEIIASTKVPVNNRSGIKGVSYHSRSNSWIAKLTFKGVDYYLGKYDNITDAAKARWEAEERLVRPFLENNFYLYDREKDKHK